MLDSTFASTDRMSRLFNISHQTPNQNTGYQGTPVEDFKHNVSVIVNPSSEVASLAPTSKRLADTSSAEFDIPSKPLVSINLSVKQ